MHPKIQYRRNSVTANRLLLAAKPASRFWPATLAPIPPFSRFKVVPAPVGWSIVDSANGLVVGGHQSHNQACNIAQRLDRQNEVSA